MNLQIFVKEILGFPGVSSKMLRLLYYLSFLWLECTCQLLNPPMVVNITFVFISSCTERICYPDVSV